MMEETQGEVVRQFTGRFYLEGVDGQVGLGVTLDDARTASVDGYAANGILTIDAIPSGRVAVPSKP